MTHRGISLMTCCTKEAIHSLPAGSIFRLKRCCDSSLKLITFFFFHTFRLSSAPPPLLPVSSHISKGTFLPFFLYYYHNFSELTLLMSTSICLCFILNDDIIIFAFSIIITFFLLYCRSSSPLLVSVSSYLSKDIFSITSFISTLIFFFCISCILYFITLQQI